MANNHKTNGSEFKGELLSVKDPKITLRKTIVSCRKLLQTDGLPPEFNAISGTGKILLAALKGYENKLKQLIKDISSTP